MLRVLERIGRWFQRSDYADLDPSQQEQLARDIGVTTYDLNRLSELGPGAAKELYERLAATGIDVSEIEQRYPRVLKDMARTCSVCREKGRCEHDLNNLDDTDEWKSYCPNADTIGHFREPD